MLPGYLLALREGLEAALVIGIVFGVLAKLEKKQLGRFVWFGVISGIIVSLVTALVLNRIGMEFDGKGEQIFEGTAMLLAASILTWMVFWMRKQSSAMKANIETQVNKSLESNRRGQGGGAIFLLAFLAVVREGIELVLFLIAIRLETKPFQVFVGALLGVISAILLGMIIFRSTKKLSLTRFFQTTNILLALFAAGLVGLGIRELNELGWVPSVIEHVWNLNALLPDQSTLGQLLRAMVGYNSNPSLSMVVGYLGYFLVLAIIIWTRSKETKAIRNTDSTN